MRFFQLEKTGTVGIEVKLDNKKEQPYSMRSNFYLLTEINQIDDLARRLVRFIENETVEIESLF